MISKTIHIHAVRGMHTIPGVAWVLAVLIAVFSATSGNFLKPSNLSNIVEQSAVLMIIALPMTIVILTEGIDMSVGAVLTLAGVVLAMTLIATNSIPLALLAAVLVGSVFGLANGLLVSRLDLPPFIVTLGSMGVAQGLALAITDGDSVVVGQGLDSFMGLQLGPISVSLALALLTYFICHVLLYRTRFGLYARAIGGNREALRLAGVPVLRYQIAAYLLSGCVAGIAALVLTGRMSAGHPTAAIGMEFDAIAATIVGGTSFERGRGWLFGTAMGVLAVGVLRNGLNLMNVQSAVQVSCIGLLVIVALLLDGLKDKE